MSAAKAASGRMLVQSAAGPSQGRPCERGVAKARSARPRAWMAVENTTLLIPRASDETAARPPRGGGREANSGGMFQ